MECHKAADVGERTQVKEESMKRLVDMDVDEFKLALRFSECRDALEIAEGALASAMDRGFTLPPAIKAHIDKTLRRAKEIELK